MKPHRTDGVSLVFGLLFLGLVVWWLLAQIFDLALPPIGWFAAGGLILLGVLGLLGALRANRNPPPAPPVPASALPASVSAPHGGDDDLTAPITGPPATGLGYDGTGYDGRG
ncbi:hypothetical protein GCM10027280_10010 [Micromonospora polyrhachis]|uniref:Uncharacterized protein n=1 Tax=Micromonospora polyrhachis TaxID=1282883 RepID=A0A7W7WNF3_9ACTN|nr:hypothetical protein [Micromonospora polyrhachis]